MDDKTAKFNPEFKRPLLAPGAARLLLEHARRLEAARDAIARHLSGELTQGWQVARLSTAALVVTTDSAARATRLRYARKALLDATEQGVGIRAKTLTVKVIPPERQPQPPPRARLSSTAAASLRQAAQGMEDGALRQALARLARRT